jgi:hypothetical protein
MGEWEITFTRENRHRLPNISDMSDAIFSACVQPTYILPSL